ncbi:hypothetical protein [Nocardiopsis salina]|uniref:hypothetical protein n=1 Tax=Nocardiopsis salina TaxID=245836 RepID=UPI0003492A8C|nr:hypothetical protein [Nocardiopsis salina]
MYSGTVVAVSAVVVALLLLLGGVYLLWTSVLPARRTARLRERFGDEYDHAVREHGGPAAAEQDLVERLRQRSATDLRDLTDEQRENHTHAWAEVQQGFVDDPAGAARRARRLTDTIMADLGYPDRGEGDDAFEQRAKDLSVDHPGAVADFHRAHAAGRLAEADRARTEDLREALVAYRGLVTALLGGAVPGPAEKTERAVERGADRGSPESGDGPVSGAGSAER